MSISSVSSLGSDPSLTTAASKGTSSAVLASLHSNAGASTAAPAAGAGKTMNESDFLLLFTTQLKNQDPTKPTDNTAFVAQLAQFSQLEATTNMSSSLSGLVSAMQGNGLMTASSLIGQSISAPGIPAVLSGSQPVPASISLPNGASSVQVNIYDALNNLVHAETLGSQPPGNLSYAWDGRTNGGVTAPDGNYQMTVAALSNGISTSPAVTLAAQVAAVSIDPSSKALTLTLKGGTTVPMSSVTSVNN